MYPSGTWRGYWEQEGFGRLPMTHLMLRFAEGRVTGEGRDIIGSFHFAGEYQNDGAIVLIKQYVGAHQVLYRGQYDGEGTIVGEWTIGQWWRGAFVLRPA